MYRNVTADARDRQAIAGMEWRGACSTAGGMWYSLLVLLTPATLPAAGLPSAPTAVCDPPALALPSTITLEPGLEPIVRLALKYSPRFRQQCRVLASARLTATVTIAWHQPSITSRARATLHRGPGGTFSALIEIREPARTTELLAHEFEHIIEQLDGVDLGSLTERGEAHRADDGAFETERAIATGRRVAGEVVDNAPDRMRGAGAKVWRALRTFLASRRSTL
jgi:hypothetical protein